MPFRYKVIGLVSALFQKISSLYWSIIYKNLRFKYKLPDDFRFNGKNILFYGEGQIKIGSGSYIGELSSIQACANYNVTIGKGCQISHNVRIYTKTLEADCDFSKTIKDHKGGNVTINDFCWIGANVFIKPGITIGKNSVVGANSIVTKDIPEFQIWGGNPARLIRAKRLPV